MFNFAKRNRIIEIEKADDPNLTKEKEQLYADLRKNCAHETVLETITNETEGEPRVSRVCTICALQESGDLNELGVDQGFNKLVKSLPILRTIHSVSSKDFDRYKKLQTSTAYIPCKTEKVLVRCFPD